MKDFQIILQARMGSTRLPGKVMSDLLGRPMLLWQIESLKRLKIPLVVATTQKEQDNCIELLARQCNVDFVRGSENNVYERFRKVAETFPSKNHIRVTGDCPLASPVIITQLISLHETANADYTSNTLVRSFPDGVDAEVFSEQAFFRLDSLELNDYQKEHALPGIYQNPNIFRLMNLLEERNLGHWRWTIDYQSDFFWLQGILTRMKTMEIPEYEEILDFIEKHPSFLRTNKDVMNV